MAHEEAAKQFSFRLPEGLIERVERCTEDLQAQGLEVTRAGVVRLLLKHALDTTHCKLELLLDRKAPKRSASRKRRSNADPERGLALRTDLELHNADRQGLI
jgi:hypothetical protein